LLVQKREFSWGHLFDVPKVYSQERPSLVAGVDEQSVAKLMMILDAATSGTLWSGWVLPSGTAPEWTRPKHFQGHFVADHG